MNISTYPSQEQRHSLFEYWCHLSDIEKDLRTFSDLYRSLKYNSFLYYGTDDQGRYHFSTNDLIAGCECLISSNYSFDEALDMFIKEVISDFQNKITSIDLIDKIILRNELSNS